MGLQYYSDKLELTRTIWTLITGASEWQPVDANFRGLALKSYDIGEVQKKITL